MTIYHCNRCGKDGPAEEFYFRKDGGILRCKDCQREAGREYYARNPAKRRKIARDSQRRSRLKHILYGDRAMTEGDYFAEIEKQGGACAICFAPFTENPGPDVDHDHATGQFRGMLCRRCNQRLHHDGDAVWFRRALAYVERSVGLN